MEVGSQFYAPAALPSGERAHGTHWIGGWAGPIAGLDAVARRKKSQLLTRIETRSHYNGPYSTRVILPLESPKFVAAGLSDFQQPSRKLLVVNITANIQRSVALLGCCATVRKLQYQSHHNGRAVSGHVLGPLEQWGRGFESE